ncbi:MAG: hypothetical protein WAM77_16720 [Xanthobacteraceae bacterium]
MLKLTKDEIAFLRWLWTNGGQASLSGKIKPGSTDRMMSAGYVVADADADSPGTMRYALTEHGREALGVYEK